MASESWKKRYNTVKIKPRAKEDINQQLHNKSNTNSFIKGSDADSTTSWLPQYYHGSPDRLNRYKQYDYMDFDVDVNMALDKTSEFCTLIDTTTKLPFILDLSDEVTTSDATILRHALKKWCRINDWNGRLFELFRSTLKYGDQILIRDPDTFILNWVDMYNVSRILVNTEYGKEPEYYFIKDVDFNLRDKVATDVSKYMMTVGLAGGSFNNVAGGSFSQPQSGSGYGFNTSNYTNPYIQNNNQEQDFEMPVSYSHICHITRSQGMDAIWPFGRSILDPVFKPFRQKELMEEATIIYRVQRSPERLVFKIDTGDMNSKKATEYLEEVKKNFKQKRQPIVDRGNGETIMDTTYSPLSMMDDFYFAQGSDGRGSTVEPLPGGECLTLDTEIMLFNGETESLQHIINRYHNGEQMWIYSVDPITGVIIPALVSWAGKTRLNTEVIKLHFNDGSTVKVTPDHKFPIVGKGMVEAKDIVVGTDELFHIDFDNENENIYFNKQTGKWETVKSMFNEFHADYPLKLNYREIFGDTTVNFNKTSRKQREPVKVVKVEELPNLDTGTITVDGNEFYTDNHTFALGNGIFTKNSTGSIDDLKFFTSRMIRALRVPISYMSYLTEDGQTYTYNDGKNGTAYMEEFSYSEYCKRLQRQIVKPLNREFKMFVKSLGIEISASDFDISFVPPQSFSEYRQIELDTAQMGVFQSIADVSYLSNRFKLKRFLGLTDSEIKENEKLWREERKIFLSIKDSKLTDGNISVPSENEIIDLEGDENELFSDNEENDVDDVDDDDLNLDFGDT